MNANCPDKKHDNNYSIFITGVVTDGEFHTLRSRGDTRALHVYQLLHDAKDSVRKMYPQHSHSHALI